MAPHQDQADVARGTQPGRILVAGDWHGNSSWAVSVIERLPRLLADESAPLILQLGDFGIWPGSSGQWYLDALAAALERAGAELWFIDGNHEDFPQLAEAARAPGATSPDGRVALRPGLYHLPRGHRWAWHGRAWLACGGGVSLDKAGRHEGLDWWPQEEITDEQEAAVIAGGHAEVMVTHECPSGVVHSFPRPPSWWARSDAARNDAHRQRLQRITDAVRPSHLMHAHLHIGYQRFCDFGYGGVQVTGLAADGQPLNLAVLDLRSMRWQQADLS